MKINFIFLLKYCKRYKRDQNSLKIKLVIEKDLLPINYRKSSVSVHHAVLILESLIKGWDYFSSLLPNVKLLVDLADSRKEPH